MNTLRDKHEKGQFTITVELDPPKSASPIKTQKDAIHLIGYADAVNIADCPMAKLRMSPIALSHIIRQDYDLETIFHLTCRDRNLIGLQAELLGASALGVHNILTLTGDPPEIGDNPDAKPVFETDSMGLIRIAKRLNEGYDMAGNKLDAPTRFYIGTTGNPGAPDLDKELRRLEEKKAAGADFVQTQPVFDEKRIEEYLKGAIEIGLPILFGVIPLKSCKMALYLHEKVPGISVTQEIRDRMEQEGRAAGIEIAADIVRQLKETGAAGAHLMPINDIPAVEEIVTKAGIV